MQTSLVDDYNAIFDAEYFMYFADHSFPNERIEKELDFLISRLKLKPTQSILDFPCGYGKYTNALSKKGFNVTGVDANPTFIQRAKIEASAESLSAHYICHDMRTVSFSQQFDCVLTLNTSWGYFTPAENRRVLTNVSQALKPGGFFVIELINPYLCELVPKGIKNCCAFDFESNLLVDWMSYSKETKYFKQKRVYILNGTRKDAVIEIEKVELEEMKGLLKEEGLNFIDVYGGLKGRPFNQDANFMVILCQKPLTPVG